MNITEIQRKCTVCGKSLKIIVKDNGEYKGGHYFGVVKYPIGDGENKKVATADLLVWR